jgi:hypothetical protein
LISGAASAAYAAPEIMVAMTMATADAFKRIIASTLPHDGLTPHCIRQAAFARIRRQFSFH